MARFVTRIADLCRHRAHEELFLRRFRMMRPGDDQEAAGPGWYESSRELLLGLQVDEGRDDEALLAFRDRYPDAATVTLEESYRATMPILATANAAAAAARTPFPRTLASARWPGKR